MGLVGLANPNPHPNPHPNPIPHPHINPPHPNPNPNQRATGWALRVLQADRVTEEPGQLYAHPTAATGSTCVAPAPLAALGAAVAPSLVLVDDAMLTLSLETQNAW